MTFQLLITGEGFNRSLKIEIWVVNLMTLSGGIIVDFSDKNLILFLIYFIW